MLHFRTYELHTFDSAGFWIQKFGSEKIKFSGFSIIWSSPAWYTRTSSYGKAYRVHCRFWPLPYLKKFEGPYEFLSKKIRKTGSFWTKNGGTPKWDRSGCSKCVESRVLVDVMTWKKFQIFVDPENIFSNRFKNPDSHFTKEFCLARSCAVYTEFRYLGF